MKKIQILIDNPNSWMVPFASKFLKRLKGKGYNSRIFHSHEEVEKGDLLVLLSCEKKFNQQKKNKFNLVIHASELPRGRGWSPLTYQVLEGKKKIPISIINASEGIDEGDIYLKDYFLLNGYELIDEIREKLVNKIFEMLKDFIKNADKITAIKQQGSSSYYSKRKPSDSELNFDMTLRDNFNLLRVVDNQRYPAFFYHGGEKFILKISKE